MQTPYVEGNILSFEYIIIMLLVGIVAGLGVLIYLVKRKITPVDLTQLSEQVSSKVRDDINRAIIDTTSKASESIGSVSKTLDTLSKTLEEVYQKLPKDVKQSIVESGINEALKDALKDLKGFDQNITQLSEDLPSNVLKSIQSSISYRKGKVGELATLMSLLGAYKRIIPLGQPVDYIGIGDFIDFIETKTGASQLTPEEKEIKEMIEQNKVRFLLRREQVEITAPEELGEEMLKKQQKSES
jgi:predicted Holliday junction resolvase-like endonuclease